MWSELIASCAPLIAASTMAGIIEVESAGNPWAVYDNTSRKSHGFEDREAAVAFAEKRVAEGASLDLGLGQINSGNLVWLGLTVTEVFEPCTNLGAAQIVLLDGYKRGVDAQGEGQAALVEAVSRYNTGHPERGISNGYVERVTSAALRVPAFEGVSASRAPTAEQGAEQAGQEAEPPPQWDSFSRGKADQERWDAFAR